MLHYSATDVGFWSFASLSFLIALINLLASPDLIELINLFSKSCAIASSKFALSGMTECWRAELRTYNVRVIQINPSEVPTAFAAQDRVERQLEDNKLTPKEISDTILASLEMDNRGMITDVTVIATNPF